MKKIISSTKIKTEDQIANTGAHTGRYQKLEKISDLIKMQEPETTLP